MTKTIEDATTADLIECVPTQKLVGLVMQLTGGSANPTVVFNIAERLKAEMANAMCPCCGLPRGAQHTGDCIYWGASPKFNTVRGDESPWDLSG